MLLEASHRVTKHSSNNSTKNTNLRVAFISLNFFILSLYFGLSSCVNYASRACRKKQMVRSLSLFLFSVTVSNSFFPLTLICLDYFPCGRWLCTYTPTQTSTHTANTYMSGWIDGQTKMVHACIRGRACVCENRKFMYVAEDSCTWQ